eukprot:GEMP01096237.1.p2 GENE.GEMP01096237.1~~GEMP01096237.1.p2  ORF type:complete len:115 (-),score=19.18 GEMP01096237.1:85-429(-)
MTPCGKLMDKNALQMAISSLDVARGKYEDAIHISRSLLCCQERAPFCALSLCRIVKRRSKFGSVEVGSGEYHSLTGACRGWKRRSTFCQKAAERVALYLLSGATCLPREARALA